VTIQSVLLGLLIASILGLLFHLIRGGGFGRLALYVATAWVSFFTGHVVGNWLDWRALRVGPLNLLPALLATVLGLIAASFLAGRERGAESRPPTPFPPNEGL
jgi:hypothetical protein